MLGICYGHQLMSYIQNGKVSPGTVKEYGLAEVEIPESARTDGQLFEGLGTKEVVWMSHGDTVMDLPPGYEVIGSTPDCRYAAVANPQKRFYGTQFHLEVTHTPSGQKVFDNFLNICQCKREWKLENFIDEEIERIRTQVGSKKVFMLVSGGVDSTVAFALLEKALGSDRVYGLFVDTGFLRLNEREQVTSALESLGFKNLHVYDARKRYFEALKDRFDPEAKRKIIGDLFLKIQAEVSQELRLNPEEWLLGQGTIYPDTIETGGTKYAAKIKTHHNRVEEIEELIKQGKVIEPLVHFYKDEVRQIGEMLGLPSKMVWRHPFPGPGLAVRCLCSQGAIYPEHKPFIEKSINEVLQPYKLNGKILPLQSVGVQGDFRTYRHPVVFLGESNFETLGKLATQLINQFPAINRALWLLQPYKIEDMKVHVKCLTPERIQLLQKADAVVSEFLDIHNLNREIWQFPTVLLPLSVNRDRGESIVLRPVCSEEAMTANFYAMNLDLLKKLTTELIKIDGITAVFYDVTNKPPGTIEWE